MKGRTIPVLVLSSLCAIATAAPDEAFSRLSKARSLKCEFGPGRNAEWKSGVLAVGSGRFGPPGEKSTIHYDSIDVATHKARVIGTGGSADLEAMIDGIGITLIERVPAGGLALTTIYGSYDARKAFPAVMSKHIDMVGPFPQQYYGSCVVWE